MNERALTGSAVAHKVAHVSLFPAVEDKAIPAPFSVCLKASSNAAVGLFMSVSHSARRTEVLLSISRSLSRSNHKVFAQWLLPGFLMLSAIVRVYF